MRASVLLVAASALLAAAIPLPQDSSTDGTRVTGTDGTRVTGTDGTRVTRDDTDSVRITSEGAAKA